MSFDNFLRYKGPSIKQATLEEAWHYIDKRGTRTTWKDYIWRTRDRAAFWNALYWSDRVHNPGLTLHARCAAVRNARGEWLRFLENVVSYKPMVPPLPN